MVLTLDQGREVVKLARTAIEGFLINGNVSLPSKVPYWMEEKRGAFVSLYTYDSKELRGCIGFVTPAYSLAECVVKAAIYAATEDPRFEPLTKEEVDKVVVEVSVLSQPEEIRVEKPTMIPSMIKVGRDGLIVSSALGSGLLLPQVAVEWGWDPEEFLSQTCIKAGLPPSAWLTKEVKVYRFQAQIFAELKPRGDVKEIILPSCN